VARWKDGGEIDIVYLGAEEKPIWVGEIKWSDRLQYRLQFKFGEEMASMSVFLERHKSINSVFFTTKTITQDKTLCGRPLRIVPSSLYCYTIGRNITSQLEEMAVQVPAKAA
jgi:hypothetical protein